MASDLSGSNAPSIDIGGFTFGIVPSLERLHKLALGETVQTLQPKLGVLGLLENKSFRGNGYNCIFRPRSRVPLPDEGSIPNDPREDDNDLQLNLTEETLIFQKSIGRVPNRGLFAQPDILLGGITYLDSVNNVTNEETGKADLKDPGTGIHIEPGIWMFVPKSPQSGVNDDTLCRMASIPHGTTINMQGVHPTPLTPEPGRPTFPRADPTPFSVDDKGKVKLRPFMNQDLEHKFNRIPADLSKFRDNGTITQEIMKNPNLVLENAIKKQNIVNFIKFDISTKPTKDLSGGGTANIAFLGGPGATMEEAGSPANAFAFSVKATYWLETVQCKFSAPANNSTEFTFRPPGDFGPTFTVPPTLGYSKDIDFTVSYLQLQYSQTVLLDFLGLHWPHVSVATLGEQTSFNLVLPPIPRPPQPKGKWGPVFPLSNVAAHASLLPTGKVLYWGRRSDPSSSLPDSMKEHSTDTYILDPVTYKSKSTASHPKLSRNKEVNLFCSGHCFQPDGSLFVVGGHLEDSHGVNQACVYDAFEDTWSAQPRMNYGRWYPSAMTLNDGSSIAISGTYWDDTDETTPMNDIPQIWRNDEWISMPRMNDDIPPSYPRLHLDPRGEIFMAGPMIQSQFLDEAFDNGIGAWTIDGPQLDQVPREYGPSVMYESGKIMYIGGGGGDGKHPPTNVTNLINLYDSKPKWTSPEDSPQMNFRRRHHNGTILPDGTVLVTGGTSGPGFNDVDSGNPVHIAELLDPYAKTPQWIEMEPEEIDRCYHSIALLMPDGQVLSAGGGEWSPENGIPNPPEDSHQDAQLFMPPYLFKGDRPTVSSAPADVDYGQSFEVSVDSCDSIAKVSWIRLGSATHACNMSQSFTFLEFEQRDTKVTINTPANSNIAPPGYYMLFLLNHEGVPSIASMVCIARHGTTPPKPVETEGTHPYRKARPKDYSLSLSARNEKIVAEQNRPTVAIGLTASCPYGLGACWSAAHRGLRNIKDIEKILPVPDSTNSIAFVYLKQDIIPDIDVWCEQFEKAAGKQYHIRGLEMTVFGQVARHHLGTDEQIIVRGTSIRPDLVLAPFSPHSKLEWDRAEKEPKAALDEELHAWKLLSTTLERPTLMQVTGRLQKLGDEKYSLEVRSFKKTSNGGTPNGV